MARRKPSNQDDPLAALLEQHADDAFFDHMMEQTDELFEDDYLDEQDDYRMPVATLSAESAFVLPHTDASGHSNQWMITLADLLALVLTFFVLLYSMSTIKQDEWVEVVTSLSQRLNPQRIIGEPVPTETLNTPGRQLTPGLNLDYLYAVVNEKIRRNAKLEATLRQADDRLILSLSSDVYFGSGTATLRADTRSVLLDLADSLRNIPNQIDVYGHTDPNPITTTAYPSNWELSLSRASTIAALLTAGGYTSPIRCYGMADAAYREIPQDLNPQERYRLSRRVDIVIRYHTPAQP